MNGNYKSWNVGIKHAAFCASDYLLKSYSQTIRNNQQIKKKARGVDIYLYRKLAAYKISLALPRFHNMRRVSEIS